MFQLTSAPPREGLFRFRKIILPKSLDATKYIRIFATFKILAV